MEFKEWLDENNINITGEYWVVDGQVDNRDASGLGDYTHEGIAIEHVVHAYIDEVADLAEEIYDQYEGYFSRGIPDLNVLRQIEGALEEAIEDGHLKIQAQTRGYGQDQAQRDYHAPLSPKG